MYPTFFSRLVITNSIDAAADLILTEVQRARTVQRKYVAFDTAAERGCEKVESPLIAEHATEGP